MEPFSIEHSRRVLLHPDTPASYVDWRELFPLISVKYRTYLGNKFAWQYPSISKPIGASRDFFDSLFAPCEESVLDQYMLLLSIIPIEDFIDYFLPFLFNLDELRSNNKPSTLLKQFIGIYQGNYSISKLSKSQYHKWPGQVILEITQSCNYSCIMCSSRTGGFLPEKTMPLERFGELVRFFSDKANSIRINGYGETTIVPNLIDYFNCFEEFGYKGQKEIITNLSGSISIYEEMLNRSFALVVSWDSVQAELFEHIRRGADYKTLQKKISALGQLVKTAPEQLVLLSTIQEQNMHEIPALAQFAADAGAGVLIYNMVKENDGSPWMEQRFDELKELFEKACIIADETGITVKIPDHIGANRLRLSGTNKTSGTFCNRPWQETLIRYDEEIQVCNMFNPYSYGFLRLSGKEEDTETRFSRLWNGPTAQLFRELINSEKPHGYCEKCYFMK